MNLRHIAPLFVVVATLLSACGNKILTDKQLSDADRNLIRSLGLLDSSETILQFYSNYKNEIAGSFYTDRRVAHYWLDERRVENRELNTAFYEDITSIDTVISVPDFDCPYLIVGCKDGNKFKVYVDGSRDEILGFYQAILLQWNKKLAGKAELKPAELARFEDSDFDCVVAYHYDGSGGKEIVDEVSGRTRTNYISHDTLSAAETESLLGMLNDASYYGGGVAACFEPHLGIVFYQKGQPAAYLSVCLDCNYLISKPEIAIASTGFSKKGIHFFENFIKEHKLN